MNGDTAICHYCEQVTKNPTKDHKFPLSKIRRIRETGEDLPEGVDLQNNIVISCGACNNLKGNKDYESFKSLGVKKIRHLKKVFINKSINRHTIYKARKKYKKKKFIR